MASAASGWIWSAPHNDYYRTDYDTLGQLVYIWASASAPAVTQAAQPSSSRTRSDSAYHRAIDYGHSRQQASTQYATNDGSTTAEAVAMPAPPVEQSVRARLPNFIAGTPEKGWYDSLDSSYQMRTGREAYDFFRTGRVFAMLFTEPAGATAQHAPDDDAFTVVRYGEAAYSQIRRFVVISSRRNFVLACAISTYKNQGTLKRGCDPSEHAVVYNTGVDPASCYLAGEQQLGLHKSPIAVDTADSSSLLTRESRIRFGKVYSIEWNVKVKDIGRVSNNWLSTLEAHYQAEEARYGRSSG